MTIHEEAIVALNKLVLLVFGAFFSLVVYQCIFSTIIDSLEFKSGGTSLSRKTYYPEDCIKRWDQK